MTDGLHRRDGGLCADFTVERLLMIIRRYDCICVGKYLDDVRESANERTGEIRVFLDV